ncbi:hypothetical protein GMOD_00007396 [Pyrenophora seminiperda CCB06]|uniref:Uncharacterized protein n=1 Tax=Pyrenophora seminiperda CCB06 TaxID=1302712 RepID=A0A3M7MD57_9PLEO|nr:hypothetical protein GMOD_00007396 [Pyrenophora seminiperda CCB06]
MLAIQPSSPQKNHS